MGSLGLEAGTGLAARTGGDGTAALVEVVHDLLARRGDRVVVGVVGAPGSGKTTLAEALVAALDPSGRTAVCVPMDGFHLADVELRRLGRLDRKGAIDTFDGWGYLALLARVRAERDHTVYAPAFERTLEQPLAGAVAVRPEVRVVVTDGNYLLDDERPWRDVRELADEIWYCDVPDDVRRQRLVDRHVRFGKSPQQARAWVTRVDEPNARRIAAQRPLADRRIAIDASSRTEETD